MPPKSQQQQAEPPSFAPRSREVTCVHESGHAVVAHLIFGKIDGVRVERDGRGIFWRGETPGRDYQAHEEKTREQFSDNENLLLIGGPIPFSIVSAHFAMWRARAIISLAGEAAERLAFGTVILPPGSDLLTAKIYTRRLSTSRAGANFLLDHCRAEARAILQRHWAAVEAIAKALDEQNELTGEQLCDLVEQNPPLR